MKLLNNIIFFCTLSGSYFSSFYDKKNYVFDEKKMNYDESLKKNILEEVEQQEFIDLKKLNYVLQHIALIISSLIGCFLFCILVYRLNFLQSILSGSYSTFKSGEDSKRAINEKTEEVKEGARNFFSGIGNFFLGWAKTDEQKEKEEKEEEEKKIKIRKKKIVNTIISKEQEVVYSLLGKNLSIIKKNTSVLIFLFSFFLSFEILQIIIVFINKQFSDTLKGIFDLAKDTFLFSLSFSLSLRSLFINCFFLFIVSPFFYYFLVLNKYERKNKRFLKMFEDWKE